MKTLTYPLPLFRYALRLRAAGFRDISNHKLPPLIRNIPAPVNTTCGNNPLERHVFVCAEKFGMCNSNGAFIDTTGAVCWPA